MKKINVSIPRWMFLFYYPIALIGLLGAGMGLIGIADLFEGNLWVQVPLMGVGAVMELTGLVAAIYMAYILGKSILEDEKKNDK